MNTVDRYFKAVLDVLALNIIVCHYENINTGSKRQRDEDSCHITNEP